MNHPSSNLRSHPIFQSHDYASVGGLDDTFENVVIDAKQMLPEKDFDSGENMVSIIYPNDEEVMQMEELV